MSHYTLHSAAFDAKLRSALTLQAFGHSPRDSRTPWILYDSPAPNHQITLWDVFRGASFMNPTQQALLFIQLVRVYLRLHTNFSYAGIKPTFLAVGVYQSLPEGSYPQSKPELEEKY